ncbi:ATP-dependent DNA helicase PcrA [Shewanella algicola]|uniref:DNA 3'-5' helicase n=1 Tax=Shewanella algicola TaxID=640633 RepID=A0A9X1ZIE1_9GAMM|nr:ATP-dependent helicase [Shewanella algicola]MCL1107503.1 ATP-dependent helicase [Shewanella algicola]GGP69699.1 ATP-dependent DNA helicase PcrA [Shewanella algicola]
MSLSTEQDAVTKSLKYHNLVLALPGAGKTHTMISFISNLVENPLHKVIALTFSNASAAEMKSRVGRLVKGHKRKQIFVSTFHSLIWSQTKKHPNFSGRKLLTGSSGQRVTNFIIENYRKSLKLSEQYDLRVVLTHSKEGELLSEPREVFKTYKFKTICNWLLKKLSETPFHENIDFDYDYIFKQGIDHFYQYYLDKLAELKYWPMDIMCVEIVRALLVGDIEPIPATRIIVDEFQDTDLVQYTWIKCHGLAGAKITVVGDDDQSIFSFRGALGVNGMRMFQDDFEVKTHTLSKCFRCGSEILSASEAVIKHNIDRVEKQMNSGASNEGEVFFYGAETCKEEFENIAEMLKDHTESSVAILARTNEELNQLETYLKSEHDIDSNRLNSKSIWESDNLKILLHIFCTILNVKPQHHLVPLLVYFNESQSNIVMISETLGTAGFGHCNIHDWELNDNTVKLNQLCQRYWHLSNSVETDSVIDLFTCVLTEFENIFSDNLKSFYKTFEKIVFGMQAPKISEKLLMIDELTNKSSKKDDDQNLPVLTTFHGAKGLEWDVVWLTGLDEENIPHQMPGVIMTDGLIEEERRLLYVAMTRAKTKLYLSWVKFPTKYLVEAYGLEELM